MRMILLLIVAVFVVGLLWSYGTTRVLSSREIVCGVDLPECPYNMQCIKFSDRETGLCTARNPCAACDPVISEDQCVILESFPAQVRCDFPGTGSPLQIISRWLVR